MELRLLTLVAGEAHFGLSRPRQHSVVSNMDLMARRAGQIAAFMLTPHPMGALPVLMASQTGLHAQLH
jgi:hypothetical protein